MENLMFFPDYSSHILKLGCNKNDTIIEPISSSKFLPSKPPESLKVVEREKPQYPDEIERSVESPEKIHDIKLESLLSTPERDFLIRSNTGEEVKVESLVGKYVLLGCFFLPILPNDEDGFDGSSLWAMKAAWPEWSKQGDVEMVVVAKMRSGWEDNQDVFNYFTAAFPSCLVIPFEDSRSRDYVCKSLGFISSGHIVYVIDPNQRVLHNSCLFAIEYGADAFPFTFDRFQELSDQAEELFNKRPVLLEELLGCNPSDTLLSVSGDRRVSVMDLKKKLVGLYVCCDLEFLDILYEKCQGDWHDLEIVVVYLPLYDDPQRFINFIDSIFIDNEITNWWILPFNDTISRMLRRLCNCEDRTTDMLIIVGQNGKYMEPNAAYATIHLNSDIYPFDVENMVEEETSRLKKLTLKSMLGLTHEHNFLLNKYGQHVAVDSLHGKTILLYLDYVPRRLETKVDVANNLNSVYTMLKGLYPQIKGDVEVVFVPIPYVGHILTDKWFSLMPWLTCPHRSYLEASIVNSTRMHVKAECFYEPTCIAFGEDGQICSLDFRQRLKKYGAKAFPFPDELHQDVVNAYARLMRIGTCRCCGSLLY